MGFINLKAIGAKSGLCIDVQVSGFSQDIQDYFSFSTLSLPGFDKAMTTVNPL